MNLTFHRWPGGSGEIRGRQIAEYLGMPVGMMPGSKPNGGMNIYVKGQPPEDYPRGRSYLDMMDATERFPWLKQHPEIGLIAISESSIPYIESKLGARGIVFIPEHHCNYARERRQRKEVRTVGVIGNRNAFWDITPAIVQRFADMGLEFRYAVDGDSLRKYRGNPWQPSVYVGQEGVREFYRHLDIQVVWRRGGHIGIPLRNPLKLENAGSFGIPTIAWPEVDYVAEWAGAFVPAETLEDMFAAVKRLKDDPPYYGDMAQAALERAEQYHIERISKKYLCLT